MRSWMVLLGVCVALAGCPDDGAVPDVGAADAVGDGANDGVVFDAGDVAAPGDGGATDDVDAGPGGADAGDGATDGGADGAADGGVVDVWADAGVDAGVDAGGPPDAGGDTSGPCLAEGTPTNEGAAIPCCPGLEALKTVMTLPDGTCLPARCVDCQICVKGCGDGACTTGEDACSCPADCPASFAGGPGAPCANGADCAVEGACLPEASGYPTGGYCTGGTCTPGDPWDSCPSGSLCVGTVFAAAYLCMASCNADEDCRVGLTCEAFPELPPGNGEYLCWESSLGKPGSQSGHGLDEPCTEDADCISHLCLAHPTQGGKVCSAFCNDDKPCKGGRTCSPMGGCGFPGCGACFAL
ncbi:MAG: hypothetical protein AMXMBFR64_51540 [Myxococcales bacterium]